MILRGLRRARLPRGDIADRIDPAVLCLELFVDDNARASESDTRGFEIEAAGIGLATRRDEQVRPRNCLATFERDRGGTDRAIGLRNLHAAAEHNTIALQHSDDNCGGFGIGRAQRLRRIEHRHLTAETAEGLREFKPVGSRADHDQMLRTFTESGNCFAGEIRTLFEPRNRRQCRHRSGRNHETPGADAGLADRHRAAVLERGVTLYHAHAEPGKTFGRVLQRDRANRASDVRLRRREIVSSIGRRQQRLGWHRGREAGAAHLALFDQNHRHAEGGSRRGHRQTAGAGADHANIGAKDFRHGFNSAISWAIVAQFEPRRAGGRAAGHDGQAAGHRA